MIKNQILIAILFLGGLLGGQIAKAMESKPSSKKISTEKGLLDLPIELLFKISKDVIRQSDNFIDAVNNFKTFAKTILLAKKEPVSKTPGIRIIDLEKDEYAEAKKRDIVDLFSAKFRVPPFIVAKKLGIEFSDESKKELRKKAIYRVLSRYNVTDPELEVWFEVNKDQANEVFTDFMAKVALSQNPSYKKINERETLIAMAAALIYANVDPDIKNKYGMTALFWAAAIFNYKGIVELLLNAGADPNFETKHGITALMSAAMRGHKEIVELLLNAGADPNIQDQFGKTALIYAAAKNYKDIIELLLNVGAMETGETKHEEALVKEMPAELLAMISTNIIKGSKNLDEAIKNFKNFAQVSLKAQKIDLLDNPYKKRDVINLFSSKFRVPPFIVAEKLGIKLTDDLLKVLREQILEAIDPILKRYDITSDEIEAWYVVNRDLVDKVFTGFMSKTEEQFNRRETLIAMAAVLIYTNVNPNIKNKYGFTALMDAARFNEKDIVELLLNANINPNIQDKDGDTALLLAEALGNESKDIIGLLLNAGADPNIKNRSGKTPLIRAARYNYKDVVKLLLKGGADPNIKDKDGDTALTWAARRNYKDIVELLLKANAD